MYTYCIYNNPSDYPNKYVVRRWYNGQFDDLPICVVESLEEARTYIPAGLVRFTHQPGEDEVIEESWI